MHVYKHKEDGIGLVEVIFALGVSVLVITSLVSLSLFSLRSSLQGKLLLRGTKFVNQELESVRALRDSMAVTQDESWDDFLDLVAGCYPPTSGGAQCHIDDIASRNVPTAPRTEGSGLELVTIYFYALEEDGDPLNPSSYPDVIKVSGTASWSIGGQTKYAHNHTMLSNWRGD